jgi:hypothetical protein
MRKFITKMKPGFMLVGLSALALVAVGCKSDSTTKTDTVTTYTFDADVLPLFTEAGGFYEGSQACTTAGCHTTLAESAAHEMGLDSYDHITSGADSVTGAPGVSILGQGECGHGAPADPAVSAPDWGTSVLRSRLRDTRMPPGWTWDATEANRDANAILDLQAWVEGGATEAGFTTAGTNSGMSPEAIFSTAGAFYDGSPACTTCHGGTDAASAHELGFKTYAQVMAGADSVTGAPGVSILGQGACHHGAPEAANAADDWAANWSMSKLRWRTRNTRMPPGWETALSNNGASYDETLADRDAPGIKMMESWITAGASATEAFECVEAGACK